MPRFSCFNVNSIKTYGYSPYFPEFASVSFKKNFLSFYDCFYFFSSSRIESCNSNLFDSFASFKIKIADETLPSGYKAISTSNSMQFHYIASRKPLPSEYIFAVAILGDKFYHAMMNGPPTVMEEFHKRKNHQQVFVDSVHETVRSNDMLQCLLSTRCNQLHCNFKLILN